MGPAFPTRRDDETAVMLPITCRKNEHESNPFFKENMKNLKFHLPLQSSKIPKKMASNESILTHSIA